MGSDYRDDLDLAARVGQGDASAFNDFYARHTDLVFAFIYHLLHGARADTEEICVNEFIVAFQQSQPWRLRSQ